MEPRAAPAPVLGLLQVGQDTWLDEKFPLRFGLPQHRARLQCGAAAAATAAAAAWPAPTGLPALHRTAAVGQHQRISRAAAAASRDPRDRVSRLPPCSPVLCRCLRAGGNATVDSKPSIAWL